MDGKMLARFGAVVFAGVAMTAAVIELTRKEEEPEVRTQDLRPMGNADPLQRLLRQCRDMGEAATRDPACLKVWAANRDRFLRQNAEAPTPSASIATGPVVKETAPVKQPEPARPGSH